MAQIPLNTQFIGLAASVDTTERRSATINAESAAYTMQDIVDTAGGGGGGSSFKAVPVEYDIVGLDPKYVDCAYSINMYSSDLPFRLLQRQFGEKTYRYFYPLGDYIGGTMRAGFGAPPASEVTIYNETSIDFYIDGSLFGGYTLNFLGSYTNNIIGGQWNIYNAPNVIQMDNLYTSYYSAKQVYLESLVAVAAVNIYGGMGLLSTPNLEYIGGNLNIQAGGESVNIDLPAVRCIGDGIVLDNLGVSFTTLNLPSLEVCGKFSMQSCPGLTDITLPNFESYGNMGYTNVYVYGCPLTSQSVDNLLIASDQSGLEYGQFSTGYLTASPSAAGIAAKNNLIAKNWSVSTN